MKIVTHKGQAHRDEFMTCCLLIARLAIISIERRDCTSADLSDPNTLVIDQGGAFDVEHGNLDHHQLERDAAPTCSITQVLAYLQIDINLAREIWLWLEFSERLDSKGPGMTASSYGMTQVALMATMSPIETSVLHWFQEQEFIGGDGPLYELMSRIGTGKLEYLNKVQQRLETLDECVDYVHIDDVLVLDTTSIDREASPSLAVEMFIKTRLASRHHPAVVVSQDDRGEGYSLYRRNDHPRVDFSRLEGHPDVTFAHKSGFIAKTTCDADWRELVKLATVPAVKPEPSVDEVCFGATPAAV